MISERIPDQLRKKMDKIKSLGGSRETRLAKLESFCIVCPVPEHEQAESSQVVWIEEGRRIICRDPGLPVTTSASNALRYYKDFTAAFPSAISPHLGVLEPHGPIFDVIGSKILETVWSGFNASLLTYGQCATGKTTHAMALLHHFLSGLYDSIEATAGRQYAVGISAWEIKGETHQDLLESGLMRERREEEATRLRQPAAIDFICVECPTLTAAKAVVCQAQKASVNFSFPRDPQEAPIPQPNRSHLFIRVVLHCSHGDRLSTFHLVDLAGFGQGGVPNLDPAESGLLQRQIHAVGKVFSELASIQKDKRSGGNVQGLVSARDHVLTQGLVPLLTGNSKNYLLACLKSGDQDYKSSLSTLKLVQQASALETACVCSSGVRLEDLDFKPVSLVLPHMGPPPPPLQNGTDGAADTSHSMALLSRIDSSLSEINRMKEKEIEQRIERESPRTAANFPPEPELGGDAWLRDYENSRREVLEKMKNEFRSEDGASLLYDGKAGPHERRPSGGLGDPSNTSKRSDVSTASAPAEQIAERQGHEHGNPQADSLNVLRNEIHSIFDEIIKKKDQKGGPAGGPSQANASANPKKQQPKLLDTIKAIKSSGSFGSSNSFSEPNNQYPIHKHLIPQQSTKVSNEERNRMLSLGTSVGDNDPMSADERQWMEKESDDDGDDFPYPSNPREKEADERHDVGTISPKVTRAIPKLTPGNIFKQPTQRETRESSLDDESLVTLVSRSAVIRSHNATEAPPASKPPASVEEGNNGNKTTGYQQFLKVLEEERQMRAKAETKKRDVEHTLLETVTQYELQVDNLRLENNRLSSKLRKLQKKSDMAEVFQRFEEDIKRLQQECEALRDKNVELSLRQYKKKSKPGDDEHHSVLLEKQNKTISKLQNDNVKLHKENFELRRKARDSALNEQLASSAHKKANKLSKKIQYKDSELETSRLNSAQAESRAQKMEAEYKRAMQSEKEMREELERALHELSIYRNRTHELQGYQNKNIQLQRFMQKHGPKAASQSTPKEPARLKEALATLSSSVRHSQPSLLPLVTQAQKALQEEIEEGQILKNLSIASINSTF